MGQKDGNVQRILARIAKSGQQLVQDCLQPWADIAKSTRLNEKAREKRMEQVAKRLLDSDRMLQLQLLGLWLATAKDTKLERLVKQVDTLLERTAAMRQGSVERCF